MNSTSRLNVFVAATVASGIVVSALQDWHALGALTTEHVLSLVVLILLSLFSEVLSLNLNVGANSGTTSIIFIPVLVGLLLFGPAAALLLMLTAGVTAEVAIRKKPPIKTLFNAGQWGLACGLGGIAFRLLDGTTLLSASLTSGRILVPFTAYAVVLVIVNNAAVSAVISISSELPLGGVWKKVTGRSGTNILYDLLISPAALAIGALYLPLHTSGLVLAFLPILFIRHSYLTNLRLQEANKDLLKALVKAIETRDPYTSGHSLRVASLARDIAEALGLSGRQIDDVETAALLHDIGKIDASYEEILRKPSDLSPTERLVIESHVTKGVELLRSLSSFQEEVLLAVRHHHEREDGRGYPDRLRGHEIPIGSKIIKICDAIDAMLSDRSYRKALALSDVRSQLVQHAGTQFDVRITSVVVNGEILERHAADVAVHLGAKVNTERSLSIRSARVVGSTALPIR